MDITMTCGEEVLSINVQEITFMAAQDSLTEITTLIQL